MNALRAVRRHFARRAFERADAAYRAYQGQFAGAPWHVAVAVALAKRADRAGHKLARLT